MDITLDTAMEFDKDRNEFLFDSLYNWARAYTTLYKQGLVLKETYCYTGIESGKRYLTACFCPDMLDEIWPDKSVLLTYVFSECTGKSPFYKLRDR